MATRLDREIRLGRYEIPAFAAGMVLGHLGAAVTFLTAHEMRHGPGAMTQGAMREVMAAVEETRRWQRLAAMITEYPHGRKDDRTDGRGGGSGAAASTGRGHRPADRSQHPYAGPQHKFDA